MNARMPIMCRLFGHRWDYETRYAHTDTIKYGCGRCDETSFSPAVLGYENPKGNES